jgi:DNA-binding IclR family transcriptional regulator
MNAENPPVDAARGTELELNGSSQLRRGLRTLELLALEPRSAAELARALGVNRSTGLRILDELEATGYVNRDAATKRYSSLPERLYALVASHDDHWDWFERVQPALLGLRDRFGEACMHAVPANGSMVYLGFFPSTQMIAVREELGTVRPMYSSALGKAYLSAQEAKALDRELGRLSYVGGTSKAPQGPIELRAQVDEARSRGYAFDVEETFDGVVCVAAPVRVGGLLVGAGGISGPASRLPLERLEEIGVALARRLQVFERSA